MAHDFRLPVSVVGPADVARLRRDMAAFNDRLQEAELRAKAGAHIDVGHPGRIFGELATLNEYDLQKAADRQTIIENLDVALKTAPTVTMSFAVDPSAVFMAKIVSWLRSNIHPLLLVRTGLQPNIAAGCTLRTTSKVYDFSLRSKFAEQRPFLVQRLREAGTKKVVLKAPSQAAPQEAPA